MAFPTTAVLDNFDRADGAPGANWTAEPGNNNATAPQIVTNAVQQSATTEDMWWNAATFGPDCEAYLTLTRMADAGTNRQAWVNARLTNPSGSANTANYYQVLYEHGGTPRLAIYRSNLNVQTSELAGTNVTLAANDKFGIEVTGTGATVTVNAYVFQSGTWTLKTTYADTSGSRLTTAGFVGFGFWNPGGSTTYRADDFGGGSVVAGGTTFSRGSGLSASPRVTVSGVRVPQPQILRPDADLDAAGWATAPLFSKVNDQSDATFMSHTLG